MSKNKNHVGIRDTYRTHLVERFSIVATSRRQTVAEHHAMVACISDRIARGMGIVNDRILYKIQITAISHDLPEVITGDIPTPIKSLMDKPALRAMERSCGGWYGAVQDDCTKDEGYFLIKRVTKLADMLDAFFFLRIFGEGNHSIVVVDKLYDRIQSAVRELDKAYGNELEVAKTVNLLMKEFTEDDTYIEHLREYS